MREARRVPSAKAPMTEALRRSRFIILVGALLVGCVGGFFLNTYIGINLPLTTQVIIAVVTFSLCIAFIYWRTYKRPDALPTISKNRWSSLWLVIVLGCFGLAEFFTGMDSQSEATRKVDRQIGKVIKLWRSRPEGIERAEEFIERIRKINTSRAPPDVREALTEYVNALDDALDAYKSGQKTARFDVVIAQKKTALDETIKKHL